MINKPQHNPHELCRDQRFGKWTNLERIFTRVKSMCCFKTICCSHVINFKEGWFLLKSVHNVINKIFINYKFVCSNWMSGLIWYLDYCTFQKSICAMGIIRFKSIQEMNGRQRLRYLSPVRWMACYDFWIV